MNPADDPWWLRAELEALADELDEYSRGDRDDLGGPDLVDDPVTYNKVKAQAEVREYASAHLRRILAGKTFDEHLAEVLAPGYKRSHNG